MSSTKWWPSTRIFPANSSFAHIVAVTDVGDRDMTPAYWNDCYFVRLRAGADPDVLARRWEQIHAENYRAYVERMAPVWGEELTEEEMEDPCDCLLVPLDRIYFDRRVFDGMGTFPSGSATLTYSLLSVAVLVIVIALINFVNFFFALLPVRLRAVNILKVFGAPNASLRFSFLFEALGFVILSQLCAWYVAIALQGTEFASYVSSSLALGDNLPVLAISLAVSLVAALVAGSFPGVVHHLVQPGDGRQGVVRRLDDGPPLPHGAARRAVHGLDRADRLFGLYAPAAALRAPLRPGLQPRAGADLRDELAAADPCRPL